LAPKTYALGEAVVCAHGSNDEKQRRGLVENRKVYLYERWGKAQKEFKPLIKHLGFKYPIELSTKMPSESKFKSRVIDNDLKDAFLALAQSDL
jgi:hypothetical protein